MTMQRLGIKMQVEVDREEALRILRQNRSQHATIVQEARTGYVKKARAALEKRLDQIDQEKIVSLAFRLDLPKDYTGVYDTAIRMLELHQGTTLTMSADEVRQLIEDEWDWSDQFLAVNAMYSGTATQIRNERA